MAVLLTPLGQAAADALPLAWPSRRERSRPAAGPSGGWPLQEVAPPAAVQQLQAVLAAREPVVEILSPGDGAVLDGQPWTLRLRVHDWPLVDGGELGLGPHLAVQLDQDPPRLWTRTEGELPPLSPGSHRLTVYAALPWGEARRNPGAVRQIQLHRTAPNPLEQPEPGSPQLLAVSPPPEAGEEPLLLDFLLLDAPLQDVGGTGTQWRLRLEINGDDVLLDQQQPLWLRGWKPGVNALRLELLDGQGRPLNSPFNSLVREVDRSRSPLRERWRGAPLSDSELAVLLGLAPPPPPESPTGSPLPVRTAAGPTELSTAPASDGSGTASSLPSSPAATPPLSPSGRAAAHEPEPRTPAPGALPGRGNPADPASVSAPPAGPEPMASPLPETDSRETDAPDSGGGNPVPATAPAVGTNGSAQPAVIPGATPKASDPEPQRAPAPATADAPPAATPGTASADGGDPDPLDRQAPPRTAAPPENPGRAAPAPEPPEVPIRAAGPDASGSAPSTKQPDSTDDSEGRVRPGTPLNGRARDLVNDDGTLRRSASQGPLAALRERLQR
ncbi:MAG: hypothetical protein ACKO0M_02185 [Cyanobium sp.]